MRILHIYEIKLELFPLFSGIKTVLVEQVKQENKINGICSKILIIDKNLKCKIRKDDIYLYGKNKNIILEYKPTFVVFHSFYFFSHLLLALFLKKNGIKYYIKPHGSFNKIAQKNSKIKFIKKIMGRLLFFDNFVKSSKGLIFLNEMERQNSIYRQKSEFIMPNGIEKLDIKLIPLKNSEYINFIFLGRIDIYHKGLDYLLEVIINNKEYFIANNVIFNFYGTGSKKDTKILYNYLNKNPEVIKYHGGIYGEEKYKVLQENDIFILTSRFEGMPMGVLEALSVGKPCFISKETGMEEDIENYNAGWVNKKKEKLFEELKISIEEFKNNGLNYRENSLKCSKKFYWSELLDEYKKNYNKF